MKKILNKFLGGTNRILVFIKWFLIALIVMLVDLTVVLKNDLPDWIGLIAIIIFLYVFIRYSKKTATILDLLVFVIISVVGAIRRNGLDGCQRMLYNFYVNTGAEIIAWAIVIGIGYLIWKSKRR